jgi:hypothetical protein
MEIRPSAQSNCSLTDSRSWITIIHVLLALRGDGQGLGYSLLNITRRAYVAMVTIQLGSIMRNTWYTQTSNGPQSNSEPTFMHIAPRLARTCSSFHIKLPCRTVYGS